MSMKSINRKSPKYFSPAQERRKERRQGYPLLKIYVPSESQMMATAPTNAAASPDPISPTELDENARALHEYLILKGKHLDRVENNFKDQSLRCRADLKQFQEIFRDKGERIFGDMDLLLEDLSARHRNRFQVLQLQLNRLHPLLNTLRAPPGLGMAGPKNSELNDQLNKIRESADAIFDEAQDSAALEEIKLVVSDHWETFFRLDNKKFFRFSCLPQARELKLRPLPDKGGRNVIWFEVSWVQNPNSQVREVKKLSKFLLDDLQVVIKLDDPNGTTSQVHNLKELHDQRGVHFKDLHRAVEFKIDLEEFRGDVQFEVRLRKEHILHSPTILSLRQNESFRENVKLPDIKMDATLDANGNEILDCSSAKLWNNMSALDRNGNNATRSNQNNGDLDESDLRAMGLHPNTTRASGLTVMETLQEASEAGEGEENRVLEHHLQKALGIKNPAPTQADNEAVTIPLTEHLQKLLNIKQNSPMRSPVLQRHHLPLDQPSPMGNTIGNNFQKGTPTVINDPTKNRRFDPEVVSTMSVTERINSIPKIDLMPEDEENEAGGADAGGDEGIGILDQAPSVDVAQFQKNLSGDDPQTANAPPSTSVNPTALPNPLNASKLDRSVSFHPHTTVFEMMSNSGNSNTANSSSNKGVNNVEEGTCHLAIGEGVNGNNLTALDMMNNTHAAALKASDATVFDMIQDDANVDASVLDVVKNKQVEQTFSELPQQQEQNPIAKKCSCGSDKKDQSTVLYEPGLTDMSRAAKDESSSRYRISLGNTKVKDGDLKKTSRTWSAKDESSETRDESLITNNTKLGIPCDSCWNLSPEELDERKMKELRLRREKSQPKTPSTDSIWDASSISEEIAAKKMKPEFDLAKNFSLARINSMSIDGTPQSVCRNTNENLDLTYVTDVLNNKIWMFAGFIHKEPWATDTAFYAPRYILSLPNGNVIVMDNKAIYLFTPIGKLLETIFVGEANRFRGLAYYKEFGRLITTETTDEVVNLVFIDIEHSKDIVDIVPIDCTRDKIKHSKVRYVACVSHEKSGLIYSTDMGLGQIYLTNMKNGESTVITHTINGTNILKHASGIAAEPSGNIIVTSVAHGKIYLFSRTGEYLKTLKTKKMEAPMGIELRGRLFFAVDAKKKVCNTYTVSEVFDEDS